MGRRIVVLVLVVISVAACGSSGPAVIPADFFAEVEVERDTSASVNGTDLKIKLFQTGKAIYDDGEISEAGVVFTGIGDSYEVVMEDSGESRVVEYGGYSIELVGVSIYSDPASATFEITTAE